MNPFTGRDDNIVLPFVEPREGSLLLLSHDQLPLWNGDHPPLDSRGLTDCRRASMYATSIASPFPLGDGHGFIVGSNGCITTWRRSPDGIGGMIFDGYSTNTEDSFQLSIERIPYCYDLNEVQEDFIVQEPPVYLFRAPLAGRDIQRAFGPMSRLLSKFRHEKKWMKIDLPAGRYKVDSTFFVPDFPEYDYVKMFSLHQLTLRD